MLRLSEMLRYDRTRGVTQTLDITARQEQPAFVDFTEAESVAHMIASADALFDPLPALLAGYGLALAAHTWRDRPSDARRGAIIQAGQLLRQARPTDHTLARLIEQCLTLADAAILRGADAEAAILAFVESEVRRRDKAAERCGRRAAELLDDGDHALIVGGAATALHWMLQTASVEQKKNITLYVAATANAQPAIDWAQAHNISAHLIDDAASIAAFAQGPFSLCIATTQQVAMDGSIAARDAQQHAEHCRQHNVPLYALGDDGPDPDVSDGERISAPEIIPPTLISAIITSRGIYRPEMIARHLEEGDAPLDVVPLAG
jgi:methylthioribose-1-phosphate isomerase